MFDGCLQKKLYSLITVIQNSNLFKGLCYIKKFEEKNYLKKNFCLIFWSLKLCIHDFARQSLHRLLILRGKVCITSWLMDPSYFALHFYGAMQTLPRKIIEQYRLCPAKSCKHSFRDQNNYQNYLKFHFLKKKIWV